MKRGIPTCGLTLAPGASAGDLKRLISSCRKYVGSTFSASVMVRADSDSTTSISFPRMIYCALGWTPMKEYRAIRSPPSTDSNKNDGPCPRSFIYTLMGVSRSAETSRITVWVVVGVASSNISSPSDSCHSPEGTPLRDGVMEPSLRLTLAPHASAGESLVRRDRDSSSPLKRLLRMTYRLLN